MQKIKFKGAQYWKAHADSRHCDNCAAVVHAYVTEQVFKIVVWGTLPLVLWKFLHMTVEAEVQTSQLFLHLAHMF